MNTARTVCTEPVELRDYFAGIVLTVILQNPKTLSKAADELGVTPDDAMGRIAYSVADAMLHARKRSDQTPTT